MIYKTKSGVLSENETNFENYLNNLNLENKKKQEKYQENFNKRKNRPPVSRRNAAAEKVRKANEFKNRLRETKI